MSRADTDPKMKKKNPVVVDEEVDDPKPAALAPRPWVREATSYSYSISGGVRVRYEYRYRFDAGGNCVECKCMG